MQKAPIVPVCLDPIASLCASASLWRMPYRFSDAMSMTKRYFTSFLSMRS